MARHKSSKFSVLVLLSTLVVTIHTAPNPEPAHPTSATTYQHWDLATGMLPLQDIVTTRTPVKLKHDDYVDEDEPPISPSHSQTRKNPRGKNPEKSHSSQRVNPKPQNSQRRPNSGKNRPPPRQKPKPRPPTYVHSRPLKDANSPQPQDERPIRKKPTSKFPKIHSSSNINGEGESRPRQTKPKNYPRTRHQFSVNSFPDSQRQFDEYDDYDEHSYTRSSKSKPKDGRRASTNHDYEYDDDIPVRPGKIQKYPTTRIQEPYPNAEKDAADFYRKIKNPAAYRHYKSQVIGEDEEELGNYKYSPKEAVEESERNSGFSDDEPEGNTGDEDDGLREFAKDEYWRQEGGDEDEAIGTPLWIKEREPPMKNYWNKIMKNINSICSTVPFMRHYGNGRFCTRRAADGGYFVEYV